MLVSDVYKHRKQMEIMMARPTFIPKFEVFRLFWVCHLRFIIILKGSRRRDEINNKNGEAAINTSSTVLPTFSNISISLTKIGLKVFDIPLYPALPAFQYRVLCFRLLSSRHIYQFKNLENIHWDMDAPKQQVE